LPFEFDITPYVQRQGNLLVVCVDGELAPDRVPPGNLQPAQENFADNLNFPGGSFDFFPFCGIHRPVLLYATPADGIADLRVSTEFAGQARRLRVLVNRVGGDAVIANIALRGTNVVAEMSLTGTSAEVLLDVPDAELWSPASPHLYEVVVQLKRGGSVF